MNETRSEIRLLGDPVLRKKAKPVKEVTPESRDILAQMSRIMYESMGIGLASPQVGINQAMIVVDIGTGLYKLINPKIVKKEGSQVQEEGCLSIPNVCLKVKRAKKVRISAQDEFAKPVAIEAQDLLACVFQHEIDHLKGKLIIDYASFFDRLKIRKKLGKLRKRIKDEGLSKSETKSCKLQL
jgi:peptide deformylase